MFQGIKFFLYQLPLFIIGIVILPVILVGALGYLVMRPHDAQEKLAQLFDW